MNLFTLSRALLALAFVLPGFASLAADYASPQEGTWVVRDFRFHTGEVLPELRLHYTTVGAPSGEPVLILHGTTGSGGSNPTLTTAQIGEIGALMANGNALINTSHDVSAAIQLA